MTEKWARRFRCGALFRVVMFLLAIVSSLTRATPTNSTLQLGRYLASEADGCPTCDALFTKITIATDGKRVQDIVLQVRGEPKSGTTFMYTWARVALKRACIRFNITFGKSTCNIDDEGTLIFQPGLGTDPAKCPCHHVDLVRIEVATRTKHELPVKGEGDACPFEHNPGIAGYGVPCRNRTGKKKENVVDLWSCVMGADCKVTDNRHQFVIMRDPRAVAVSTYFHLKKWETKNDFADMSIDNGVLALLPGICQWVAIRHLVFEGVLADKSTVFWYQEAIDDPLLWHYRLTAAVGLQLPSSWIEALVVANSKMSPRLINMHPGGKAAEVNRTWQDEISSDLMVEMNTVARTWLPPVILARLGLMSSFTKS